jgi:hypothetical protein
MTLTKQKKSNDTTVTKNSIAKTTRMRPKNIEWAEVYGTDKEKHPHTKNTDRTTNSKQQGRNKYNADIRKTYLYLYTHILKTK